MIRLSCCRHPRAVTASTHATVLDGGLCEAGMLGKTMTETTLYGALTRIAQVAADGVMAVVWTAAPLAHALLVLAWPLVTWPMVGAGDSRVTTPPASRSAGVWAVEATFREALQLWADGQFEVL